MPQKQHLYLFGISKIRIYNNKSINNKKMKTIRYYGFIFLAVFYFSICTCEKENTNPEFPVSNDEYLGQEPPGMIPKRFPPANLQATNSWCWHSSPMFSNELNEMFFGKFMNNDACMNLNCIFIDDGEWTIPKVPTFALNEGETNPFYFPDENTLYFISYRNGKGIYKTNRINGTWTEPEMLNIPIPENKVIGLQFSIAASGTIYFLLWISDYSLPPDIYKSELENGRYTEPVNLGSIVNSVESEICPFIDPNEEYLIFSSNRTGGYGYHDLYISFKTSDNSWSVPVNMGNLINSDSEDTFPGLSPEGNYLFFISQRTGDLGYNPYWVDSEIIENLRPK